MQNGILAYNNGEIYYQVSGSGDPIVFIHGFSLDHMMWQPQRDAFRATHQVITYDARGFGKSSVPTGPYSHVADLCALLDHLGVQQAHVVGLSMGGRIATNFVLEYPDMVRSLTLIDSSLDGYANEIDWNVYAKEQGLEKAKENWLNHEIFAATQRYPEVITALRSIVDNYSGWHWLHTDTQTPFETLARQRLHEIVTPVLIIIGANDVPYFHNIAAVFTEGIEHAQRAIVSDAGHMVNMEVPNKVNELLADFIAL